MPPPSSIPLRPSSQEQCITCAYPLDRDRDILSALSRVKSIMHHVGYNVDRVSVEQLQDTPRLSVTLELAPKKRARSPPHSPEPLPPPKRPAAHCRLCASSCCSTNSLCKANVCNHHDAEESRPAPLSPDPSPGPHASHTHHHHHKHPHTRLRQPHAAAPSPSTAPGTSALQPAAPPPNVTSVAPVRRAAPPHVVPDPHAVVPDPHVTVPSHLAPVPPSQSLPAPLRPAPPAPPVHAPSPPHLRPPISATLRGSATGWTATTAPAGAAYKSAHGVPFAAPGQAALSGAPGARVMRSATAAAAAAVGMATRDVQTATENRAREQGSAEAGRLADLRAPPELACALCGLGFGSELELRIHQFTKHKDDKMGTRTSEGRFLCLMHSCSQSFVRRHVMERHFKTVHMLVREFPCASCDRSFADSSTREAHRSAVHEKLKPWVCDQCSSCFTQSSSLGKHRRRFHQDTAGSSSQK